MSLLILGAGQALAASREDRAFDTAAAAFQDERVAHKEDADGKALGANVAYAAGGVVAGVGVALVAASLIGGGP